jgi:hypothetical protein
MDFFINSDNFCDTKMFPGCLETIKGILKNHNVASHTVHHMHMGQAGDSNGTPDTAGCGVPGAKYKCEDELSGVETLINTLSGGGIPHITRFRAPYGEPFQIPTGVTPSIRATVAKFAIHIGWAMESGDANDDAGGLAKGNKFFADAVMNATGGGPGKGKYGLILMHGTYPWSLGEAKILLDPDNAGSLQKHGFKIGTVEDAICWKYGKHSWEIIEQLTKQPHTPN